MIIIKKNKGEKRRPVEPSHRMCHARALICCQVSCCYPNTPPAPPTHPKTILPHHRSRAVVKIRKYFVCLSADSKACVSAGLVGGPATPGRRGNLAGCFARRSLSCLPQGWLRVVGRRRTVPTTGARGRVSKHQENTKGKVGKAHFYPA